ncbi:hypothetical protein DL897_08845 [Thermoflavimicrobium daqui]|uniref:Uncharacterized protein n=1 Tax=Thermoflavimicrobium daqui TaxID=2137476 RepID=A0A364K4Z2_9BACL|nr:hypothetical protein DL897_08845 [Thermoflavimicrobium daqui]
MLDILIRIATFIVPLLLLWVGIFSLAKGRKQRSIPFIVLGIICLLAFIGAVIYKIKFDL